MSFFPKVRRLKTVTISLYTTLFLIGLTNYSFFQNLLNDYPLNSENAFFLFSLSVGICTATFLVLLLLCNRFTLKPLLIFLFFSASIAAYFMDSYNIMINDDMVKNIFETDTHEVWDLISVRLFVYVLLLGILPAFLIVKTHIQTQPFRQECLSRVKYITFAIVILLSTFFLNSSKASSFFREHKDLVYYINPGNYIAGSAMYLADQLRSSPSQSLTHLGEDALISEEDEHQELIIMVVGETARADHFSLNGYEKKTNPLLEKQNIVSFQQVESCGTLTAISVPCMFAVEREDSFDKNTAKHEENALDILKRAGVNILWRDNNSSSKHVADRVQYEDFQTPETNPICDIECRDEGMLIGLQDYIDAHANEDILIVLHQMGNHGPAYYKRYPKSFEKFTPACQTNELSDCSEEEINNAYDNAILYTDYFLNKVIELLKRNDGTFEPAMIYVSDHGESLGEHGIYLHGIPNFIAPESQRHVPVIMWIGNTLDEISFEALNAKRNQPFSHDNIFHTLLGIMEVESNVYKPEMDMTR